MTPRLNLGLKQCKFRTSSLESRFCVHSNERAFLWFVTNKKGKSNAFWLHQKLETESKYEQSRMKCSTQLKSRNLLCPLVSQWDTSPGRPCFILCGCGLGKWWIADLHTQECTTASGEGRPPGRISHYLHPSAAEVWKSGTFLIWSSEGVRWFQNHKIPLNPLKTFIQLVLKPFFLTFPGRSSAKSSSHVTWFPCGCGKPIGPW